jgi:hypothetical protein
MYIGIKTRKQKIFLIDYLNDLETLEKRSKEPVVLDKENLYFYYNLSTAYLTNYIYTKTIQEPKKQDKKENIKSLCMKWKKGE